MTRAEIRKLAEAKDEDALKARLGSRMSFGTAGNIVANANNAFQVLSTGLRAAMGAGYSRMNQLTIIQTTQVVNYQQLQFYAADLVLHIRDFVSISLRSSRMPDRGELLLAEMQDITARREITQH